MNNKSRIALAIAAALGVSTGAIAQTSTVQIGGSLNMFYQKSTSSGGSTGSTNGTKSHDNLSLSEPEIWIHGEENLGGGMTAWFRCTSSFDLMGTSASATTTAGVSTAPSGGNWCGRNSALGFKGNFGNIFAGTWDTPQKLVAGEIRGWWGGTASLTGGFANMLLGGAGSNTGNSGATFYERRARSISYHSPNFSGFRFKGMFSAQNEATVASAAATQSLNQRLLGLNADYTNGPLYIGVGWEQHKDHNPAARFTTNSSAQQSGGTISTTTTMTPAIGGGAGQYSGGKDNNYLIGARYTFAFGTRLSGLYTKTKYETSNGAEATKAGWAIFFDHALGGPHSIKGQYFKVGDTKGNAVLGAVSAGAGASAAAVTLGQHQSPGAGTGGHGWSLAYMYAFSKRTSAGFVYGVIDNDTNATYSKGVNTAAPGATQRGYGLNVRHSF